MKIPLNSVFVVLAVFGFLAAARSVQADLNVVREVVVGPKGAVAAANIGSVNSSSNVHMVRALVEINVGPPGVGAMAPIQLSVRTAFEMVNESSLDLLLTVGFPVSYSEFSSSSIDWFRVATDGETREVFRRITGYPRKIVHEYISGTLGERAAVAPADVDSDSVELMGGQIIGAERFGNLMVWSEAFSGGQKKNIEVLYDLQVPLQETTVMKMTVEDNRKGIWPQEANNVPAEFLRQLDGQAYYFFDYFLTSGASWAGPIGEEDITVNFGPWWNGHEFHSSAQRNLLTSGGVNAGPGASTTYYYLLRNEEPLENLYFAVRPRASN